MFPKKPLKWATLDNIVEVVINKKKSIELSIDFFFITLVGLL